MSELESLDVLLPSDESHATFHDARLISLSHDEPAGTLISDWRVWVGDPDAPELVARERTRPGRLKLDGLAFWVSDRSLEPGAWLTSDGDLAEAGTPLSRELASRVEPGMVAAYLYFSDTNSFAYFAAASAGFEWLG